MKKWTIRLKIYKLSTIRDSTVMTYTLDDPCLSTMFIVIKCGLISDRRWQEEAKRSLRGQFLKDRRVHWTYDVGDVQNNSYVSNLIFNNFEIWWNISLKLLQIEDWPSINFFRQKSSRSLSRTKTFRPKCKCLPL